MERVRNLAYHKNRDFSRHENRGKSTLLTIIDICIDHGTTQPILEVEKNLIVNRNKYNVGWLIAEKRSKTRASLSCTD